jgi:hypothetical protein
MGKKKKSSHAEVATKPPKKVTRRRRKSWEFEIVLCETSKPNERHPLFGLSAEQREQSRVAALGRILASLAIRKMTEPNNSAVHPSSEPT